MVAAMAIVMAAVFGTVLVTVPRFAVMAMVVMMVAVVTIVTGVFSTICHRKNFGLANMLGM